MVRGWKEGMRVWPGVPRSPWGQEGERARERECKRVRDHQGTKLGSKGILGDLQKAAQKLKGKMARRARRARRTRRVRKAMMNMEQLRQGG
jgi:hypothetical protein